MLVFAIPFVILALFWIHKYQLIHLQGPERPEKSIPSAVLKCFPVLYLVLLVRYTSPVSEEHRHYRDHMAWGLIFSMGGDFSLTWFKKLFIPGVLSFGTAHVFYILAFKMAPIGPLSAAVPFVLILAVMVPLILPNLNNQVMKLAVGVYIGVICTMGWRAAVVYSLQTDLATWVGLWGAIIFIVSDTFIALSSWVMPGRIPKGVLIIMVTYYLGQLLLAYSVLIPTWDVVSRRKYIGA